MITTGCGDACPVFPGKRYLDWPVDDDPAGQDLETVRRIRDDIADDNQGFDARVSRSRTRPLGSHHPEDTQRVLERARGSVPYRDVPAR